MVALTEEMKDLFKRTKIFPMATASKDGVPNVAPMATVRLVDDETIWIMDNYMVKNLANLQENPNTALYFYDPDTKRCFQVKGRCEVKTSGREYEQLRDEVKAKSDAYPAKSLVIIRVTGVFECTPGKDAGKRVL